MELLVVVQNLGRGALRTGDGAPYDAWPQVAGRLQSAGRPDLALLQEAEGWSAESHRQLTRAEQDLDMDGLLAPSRSGLGPALFYRRETLGRRTRWNTDYAAEEMHHGTGVATWDLPALPAPLSAASIHLTPYSADKALMEADFAASRVYKNGPYAIVGGDINFAPQAGPDPDYSEMRPYNLGSRTRLTDPAAGLPPAPDRRVAWKLAQNGFVDAAWHLYLQTGAEELLRPTGTDDRIDQLWVSAPLAPALTGYQLLDDPAGGRDHHGLAVRLDLTRAITDEPWAYR